MKLGHYTQEELSKMTPKQREYRVAARSQAIRRQISRNLAARTPEDDENDLKLARCLDIAETLPKKLQKVLVDTIQHQNFK